MNKHPHGAVARLPRLLAYLFPFAFLFQACAVGNAGAPSISATSATPPANRPRGGGMVVTSQVSTAGVEPTAPDELERRRQAWLGFLQHIGDLEHATMIVEVPMWHNPPAQLTYPKAQGALGMRILATVIDRNWSSVGGVQTFTEAGDELPHERGSAGAILAALSGLTSEEWQAALDGRLTLDQLTPERRRLLLARLIRSRPELADNLVNRTDSFTLKVQLAPMMLWDQGGKQESFIIPFAETPNAKPRTAASTPADGGTASASALLPPAPAGALDFHGGQLLRLHEIISRAESVFHAHYQVDTRLFQTWYFVRGSLTRDSFEAAAKTATSTLPLSAIPDPRPDFSAETQGFLNNQARELLRRRIVCSAPGQRPADEAVSPAEFLAGAVVPVSRLAGETPWLYNEFSRLGLLPDSLVSLRAGLAITIDGGGFVVIGGGSGFGGLSVENKFKYLLH